MDKVKTGVTMAELQRLEAEHDDKRFEVEDGEIIEGESAVTWLHMMIMLNLFRMLDAFVRTHKLGTVYPDGARYVLAATTEDIQRAYEPDLSFLRPGRIPADFDWNGDFTGTPDLAVEITSPGQSSARLLAKIARYLEAGSEEAWLIYPQSRTLYQFRRDEAEPRVYREGDSVDVAALFPGLTLNLADLFVTDAA